MNKMLIDSEESLADFNACIDDNLITIIKHNNDLTFEIDYCGESTLVEVSPEFLTRVNYDLDDTTKFIYGKNPLDRVVNISYKENNVHIFRLQNDGSIKEIITPYIFWALSNYQSQGLKRLKGNRHYKAIKEYRSEADYLENKNNIYKYRAFNINHVPEAFMTLHGLSYYKNLTYKQIPTLSFDIETSGLDPLAKNATVFLITNTFRDHWGAITRKTFNIDNYDVVEDMIEDWYVWVRTINPSIILGHNILLFDLPYLAAHSMNQELLLGTDGSALEFEDRIRQKRKDGSQSYSYRRATIFGREIIDTFFLMLTADAQRKMESYALKPLIKAIGQEKEGRTYIDSSKIAEYWNDPIMKAKVIQYAEEDADDALKLYDEFAAPYFYFTQHIPKTFQMMMETATGGQLNSFLVRSYLQNGESIPQADDISEEKVEGGISFGVPGIYKNLFKIDIKSAYPSQVLRLKLYNETKDPNANFYNMVHYFANKRFEYKKLAKETGDKHWKDLDAVNKIVINSAYGVCNTSGLNFNDAHIAQVITKETREVIDMALRWASGEDYKFWINRFYDKTKVKEDKRKYLSVDSLIPVTTGHCFIIGPTDTDSISFCKRDMSPFSKEEIITLNNEVNKLSPEMIEWEDDGYYDSCLSLKAKNYVLKKGDKYTIKGSALKSSKLEPALKQFLDDLIKDSLNNEGKNLKDIYESYILEAMRPNDISRWCKKITVTKPVLESANDPEARKNEADVWDAIKDKQCQEGDKIYVYPVIKEIIQEEKVSAKGKVTIKNIEVTGLKCIDDYNNDVNPMKLIERVYSTACILDNIVDESTFIDYTLVKNKHLLGSI